MAVPGVKRAARWLLGVACALALAPGPVRAAELGCVEWLRLGAEQKAARLSERMDAVIRDPELRQTNIERGKLRRCLDAETARMVDDFDDACADGLEADLQALDRILRDYVDTCAG